MTSMQQFYLDRAAEAGRTAAAAPLANVRERHLLAELTWNGLAVRAGRVDTMARANKSVPLPLQQQL